MRLFNKEAAPRSAARLGAVLAAALVVLVTPSSVPAATPQAQSATVHATDRYVVTLADETLEYQIPIDLLAFVSDADGDVLTFTTTAPSPEGVGFVVDHGDGLVVYRVGVEELALTEGFASFDFTATDPSGASSTATVTISDHGGPTLFLKGVEDAFIVRSDRTSPLAVLENDENADTIAEFTEFTTAGFGQLSLSEDGTFLEFTPGDGFGPGVTDSFEYRPAGPAGEGDLTSAQVKGAPEPVLQVVRAWDQQAVSQGDDVAFPRSVAVGDADSVRFELVNPGTDDLEITNAASAVSGDCFSVIEEIPTVVEPEASTTASFGFRVRVQCPTAGTKTATVRLETRSASGAIYDTFVFTLTAQVTAGPTPLVVRQHWDGAVIADGATLQYPNHAVFDFPTSFAVDVENPAGSGETIEVVNADEAISGWGFEPVLGAPVPGSVGEGATELFRVRLHVEEPGTEGATTVQVTGTVTLDSATASGVPYDPFSFTVEATVHVPEIGVFRGWPGADPNPIPGGVEDETVVELPTVAAAGDAFHSVAFQVHNTGSAGMLAIFNPDASLVNGDCFVVKPGGFPEQLVAVGESTPFRVWWGGACGPGTYSATVSVVSNAWTDFYNPFLAWNRVRFTIVGRVALLPELTCDPADARVAAGDAATFEVCVANDDGSFTYTWYKDGVAIAGSGPTLTLSAVTDADEGDYHVEVMGAELGPVASAAATLTVVDEPVVSRPADRTIEVGGSATFSVTATPTEDGPFSYVWQELPPGASTFQTISGATTDTLTVSGVTLAMDGTRYRCLVSNDAGQSNSGAATLTVVDAPTISQQPESQRVVAGSNVSFSVTASGSPAPSYLWKKDGVSLGVTTATLSLSSVTDTDEGSYRVTVSNSQGSVTSQAASLTVVNKPVVSRPVNRSAPLGGSATFSVTVSSPAEDGPFSYVWQRLPPGASSFQTISGANGSSLTVSNVTAAMDGTRYRCLVRNEAGQSNSGSATLTVLTPDARVTRNWDGVAVGEGTTFDFGTAERNVATSRLFRITNAGDGTLNISNPTNLVGGACFSQISNAASSVAPGGSTTFRVRLHCSSTGLKTGQVTIYSDDPTSPYVFYLRGNLVASNVHVAQNWDGATVGAGTTVSFGSVETGVATSRRFRITNTGQATLTISNPTSLVSGTCWSQIENPASTVAPGATTYFRVRLLCSSTGTKSGTVTIYSNDPSSPYRFYVQGTVTAPDPGDVTVYRAWNGIHQSEGSTFTFPNTTVGSPVSRRFRITNTGTGTLTISNPTSFVSGTCWRQIENAASTVAPGASTYFRVRLYCNSTGTKSGTVTIYSNDTSSPYRFYLSGTVTN